MKRLIAGLATAAVLALAGSAPALAQATTTAKPGEFCSPSDQGQTMTAASGEQISCMNGPDGHLRWEPAAQVVATQSVVTTAGATPPSNLAHTGALAGRVTAFGAIIVAFGWVLVASVRPRILARRSTAAVADISDVFHWRTR